MSILELMPCLAATEILVCEISGRDDRISSCNHDMDLVIGKVIGRLTIVSVMGRIRMLKKNAIVARCDNFRR